MVLSHFRTTVVVAVFSAGVFTSAPLLVAQAPVAPITPAQRITVDRIFKTGELRPVPLPTPHWLRDGVSYIDVQSGDSGSAIVKVNAVTGATTVLVPASVLVANGKPIAVEDLALSDDERRALLYHDTERVWRQNTRGMYTVVDLDTKHVTPVAPSVGVKMFAKFSPDGRRVAYVRANDLYVFDIATGTEQRLTTDGSAEIVNGTSDWVYEEEFDLRDAFRWSPDGAHIAYWHFDKSQEPLMTLLDDVDSLYPVLTQYKYPKAGQRNALVKIGVVGTIGSAVGQTRWMETGPDSAYLMRMDWLGADSLWIERMPRKQNQADLLVASAATGATRVLLTDRDSTYVDVVDPVWANGDKQVLWISDRSGWRQLYVYDRTGKTARQLSKNGYDVLGVAGVDEKRGVVYARAAMPNATQAQILAFALDGSRSTRATTTPGSYELSLAPGGHYAALTYSSLNTPPRMTLVELPSMRSVRTLGDNAPLASRITSLGVAPVHFLQIPAADGKTMLDAYRVVPPGFDSTKKYPVLMYAYGGPAIPTVLDAWAGSRYFFHQMLAQRGYVVIVADNRGSAWRGRRFRKMTQYRVGITESDDQIAVARWVGRQAWGDSARIGMWGWSYGGYNTAMSAFRGGDVFRVAISVAPVSDWRFYDSIYAERFMWLPSENTEGYTASSALQYVGGLKAKYLLVYGMADDNVHPQNSTALAQRLQLARKPFYMMAFPNKTHSISGPGGTLPIYDLLERFVVENL